MSTRYVVGLTVNGRTYPISQPVRAASGGAVVGWFSVDVSFPDVGTLLSTVLREERRRFGSETSATHEHVQAG